MQTLVYVINRNGRTLMPCKPAKAKHLLKAGKAKVKKLTPFTIQLLWDCEEHTQPVTLGIDKGSKFTGVAAVSNNKLLFQAEIKHRLDIKEKLETRRAHRRSRRNRKWYRKPRFLNRKSFRPLPSIKANADEVIRVVRSLPLPITKLIVEDVLVDIAKLNNPTLKGKHYQKSTRLDENLRLACLMRDDFKCRQCGYNEQLNAHHIVWRSNQGKDTINNLITLCKKCHDKVHTGKLKLSSKGVSGFKDKIAQRTMQGKTYLYKELGDPTLVYGYETATKRNELKLTKTHMIDAFVIATMYSEANPSKVIAGGTLNYNTDNAYSIKFRARQTRKLYHDLAKKGVGRARYQVNEELAGFRKGDIVKVFSKTGSYVKQVNSIYSAGRLAFARIKGEPGSALPKNCRLLTKSTTISIQGIL